MVTDGDQGKSGSLTYPLDGLTGPGEGGVVIPFTVGHQRQLPVLASGPFRHGTRAESYLRAAMKLASVPVKQSVVAPSALSLLYPADGIGGYPREAFLGDLVNEAEADIRGCLDAGAPSVQLDFTEGRLALKLDPSGGVLESFVDLNNRVLERFAAGTFSLQLASEPEPGRVLAVVAEHLPAETRVFVGVTDPLDPRVEGTALAATAPGL